MTLHAALYGVAAGIIIVFVGEYAGWACAALTSAAYHAFAVYWALK